MPFSRRRPRRPRSSGQSVVEFSLVLPILILLLLAIVDLSRIYTTMVSVESAAREAADYGSFGSQKWSVGAVTAAPPDSTVDRMHKRACVAASDLPDYVGPDDACTNPAFSYALSTDRGATWVAYDAAFGCDDPNREPPCWLKVTLDYDFKLFAPFNIEIFGREYGLPSHIAFTRESVFPMTDLDMP